MNVGETLMRGRCYRGVALVNFQPKSATQDEQIRTGLKNLRQAQLWQSRFGNVPSGLDHLHGEQTYDPQTLQPSGILGASRPLFARRCVTIQAECRAKEAKSLSDAAISADSSVFSARRN